jgi:hypothetical protein
MAAALEDFKDIFLNERSSGIVLAMLSVFAREHIDQYHYGLAASAKAKADQAREVASAFENFDHLANCLNHIFEQFAINQLMTRSGLVPRQDEKISSEVYTPTLKSLAEPKWKSVSVDLGKMFEDYRNRQYAEVITKAHSALQRFLQVLVGEEGKNAKGELRNLFADAKQRGILQANRFTEPLVGVIQGFVPSERANNSTAKPSLKDATSAEALLVMNVVMVFIQFCLQNTR